MNNLVRKPRDEIYVGKKIGALTITKVIPRNGGLTCECSCECGRSIILMSALLVDGKKKSCGQCGYKERRSFEALTKDLTGQKFGRLIALYPTDKRTSGRVVWHCSCKCGREKDISSIDLVSGHTRSCGQCLKFRTPEEKAVRTILMGMRRRCYIPECEAYPHYGGRGITICEEWMLPHCEGTRNFVDWALTHGYEKGLSIDRIDNDGPYAPWNCRWTTWTNQANNRSYNREFYYNERFLTLSQWADYFQLNSTRRCWLYKADTMDIMRFFDAITDIRQISDSFYNKHPLQRKEFNMFSLINNDDIKQIKSTVNFNTDSIVDLLTGNVVRGKDGKWYINGGLGPAVAGINGRPGCFKSTFAGSLCARVSAIYDSQMIVFDSEDAISRNKERILSFAGDHASKLNDDYVATVDAKNLYDLESMRDMIRELGEKKKSLGEDAMLTTPFLDSDGNVIKVFRPTCVLIDSYTECFSKEEETLVTDKGIDDSRAKTLFLLDANKKTTVLRNLSRYAAEYGIEIVTTAHYGSKLNMDSYLPSPKLLQWSAQNDSPKGVGSKYAFLTSPLMLVNSISKLLADDKTCKYKFDSQTSPTDLSEIVILMQRCKNNASGLSHPFVISQDNGLLTETSDYSYLRTNKGFMMQGNNITHQSMFLPDINLTRNTFRKACSTDHRITRALQLSAQLLYIQNNWSSKGFDFSMKPDPKKFVDFLMSDKSPYTVDRILNSRSYWLPEELKTEDTPEYLSIFDILELYGKSDNA